jgi:beta-galactosidase
VNIEAQVRNESGDQQSITLSAVVVDAAGKVCAKFSSEALDLVSGQTENFSANGKLSNAKFWSDETPNLYDVYSMLSVNDKIVDVQKIKTGFRKAEFKGGAGTGGVWINDKFLWLTGYAQRSSDDWAGLGEAYPDWMHDFNAALVRSTHANYIRWMHIAPQAVDVRACDQFGIVEVCPAGDKEGDPVLDKRLKPETAARQWDQRVEVMRDAMIYFRNNPSIFFWEAGNNGVTTPHLQQMVDLQKQLDPNGGRVMGCRTLNEPSATPVAGYFGVMIGQDKRTDALANPTEQFRAYSAERRDRAPFIETEDFRDEAARRFWDDFSPPHFGFKPGPNDTYKWNSETFCLAAAERYHAYAINEISNPDPAHSKWSAYASIYWSDSNADGRQDSSEVCRVSGKVDSVRLPKQAYYVYRVMQSATPDLHIIGHWNYPTNTVKTVYVAANHCDSVELLLNGKSMGICTTPADGYIFVFPEIKFEAGKISAVAKIKDKFVAQAEIETAGEAKSLKLTPHVAPNGLLADGADVAFFDVEVVDAQGRRCPTDEVRVDFKLDGPAIWRGGYNSGKINSVNNLWLDTECGINRVAIRSTLKAGVITLTATRDGLQSATAKMESLPVEITGGLAKKNP